MDALFFPDDELKAAVDAIEKVFSARGSSLEEVAKAFQDIMKELEEQYIEEYVIPPKQYGMALIKPKHPINQKLTYTYLRKFVRGLPYQRRNYTNN